MGSSDVVLMKISVRIRSIRAFMVHRFTNLPLAEINLD